METNKSPVEEWLQLLFINTARTLDLLYLIARTMNKEEADKMMEDHARGEVWGPPPAWNMSDESLDK